VHARLLAGAQEWPSRDARRPAPAPFVRAVASAGALFRRPLTRSRPSSLLTLSSSPTYSC